MVTSNKYKIALVKTHFNDSQSTKIQQCHKKMSLKESQLCMDFDISTLFSNQMLLPYLIHIFAKYIYGIASTQYILDPHPKS